MIRSKAKLHKSIPLFFLLASAASLAAASDLPEKRRFREEIQRLSAVATAPAANSSAVDASAVQTRNDRPARNADRGRDGRGDDNGRRGNHNRGDNRGGRRHDADRGRGGRDGRRHDADRGRGDNRRWDNDGRRDQVRRDGGRYDSGRHNGGRYDNGRRDDRWQHDGRRGDWGHNGRHDRYDGRGRHDRWEHHSRYGRRWDGHRWHGPRHSSWDHGYRGHRAWHNLHLRNGFYFGLGRYLDYHFSVPSFITIDYDPTYEEYYYGSVYHPGYGRDFEVFLFPTYYGDRVEYIPHAYADGRLFGRGRIFSGGGSGISIRFDF